MNTTGVGPAAGADRWLKLLSLASTNEALRLDGVRAEELRQEQLVDEQRHETALEDAFEASPAMDPSAEAGEAERRRRRRRRRRGGRGDP
jgi:hypothetical protein